ncbi:hypothetical protein P5673_024553 [Acropora cervicornis]|uniref:Uncharacterized protein n=1 Tax=Acropora cervicornis TaxID=6130 RepID=A0AAD9UY12_ACRCE|nr:hypothetical protein P5673_024553 [Acropora cervicornis]
MNKLGKSFNLSLKKFSSPECYKKCIEDIRGERHVSENLYYYSCSNYMINALKEDARLVPPSADASEIEMTGNY